MNGAPAAAIDLELVRTAYDSIATHNDLFHDHPRFDLWLGQVRELIESHRPGGRRLLDVGCGAGRSSIELARAGYVVSAYDLSPGMIRQARSRPGSHTVNFVVGNLCEPPDLGTFDVIVCFNEAFSHLADESELTAVLQNLARNLAVDGILVFDLSTLAILRRDLGSPFVLERPDLSFAYWAAPTTFEPDSRMTVHARWYEPVGDLWRRCTVELAYQHFSIETVRRATAAAGLSLLRIAGLGDDGLIDDVREDDPVKVAYVVGLPEPGTAAGNNSNGGESCARSS